MCNQSDPDIFLMSEKGTPLIKAETPSMGHHRDYPPPPPPRLPLLLAQGRAHLGCFEEC